MRTFRALLALALLAALSACGATYRYTRTADGGCSLEIESPRNVQGPIDWRLHGCDLDLKLGGLSSPLEQIGGQVVASVLPALLQRVAPTPAPLPAPAIALPPNPAGTPTPIDPAAAPAAPGDSR